MRAVILAGGKGERLRPLIKDIPKPMAAVGGRPFLECLINQLEANAIKEIILSVGYKAAVIKNYFGSGKKFGVHIRYAYEDKPLGTAGALRNIRGLKSKEDVLVLNGDSFLGCDLKQLIAFHKKMKAKATIALTVVSDTSRYGKVRLNKCGVITDFCEKKPGRGYVNAGVYVINREVIDCVLSGFVSLENDVFPKLVGGGLYGRFLKGFFIDIGLPASYRKAVRLPRRLIPR